MGAAEERERERERSYPDPSDPFIEVKFGNNFVDIPSNADESPAWSLLVGVKSGALRVHRFHVARSGRISGRSDDDIQVFHDLKKRQGCSSGASATLAPDGRSLCLLQLVENAQADGLQLLLPAEEEPPAEVALPPLDPSMRGRCMPISADGHIWAVSATYSSCTSYCIRVQRLVIEEEEGAATQHWEQVGIPLVQLCKFEPYRGSIWGPDFLQGYAVLPGHGREGSTLILLSLQNGLFFTFNCSSADLGWTKVTQTSDAKDYVPILGRGLYAQESNAIYMLRKDAIYAYKLGYEEGSLKMDPPVDIIFPYVDRSTAHGFLTHLGSGVMCSVLMSVGLPCWPDHLHAIITTFHLGPDPSHIKVLHSTSRQVDMLPMKDINEFEFSFLQEYKDDKVRHQVHEVHDAEEVHEEEVLHDPCIACRHLLPPGPPAPYVKPHMDNELLFIICQAGSQSFIYKTSLMDLSPDLSSRLGIATPLKPHYIVHGDDCGPRHFFLLDSKLHAVSFLKDGMDVLNLDTRCEHLDLQARRPVSPIDPFVMVIQVGRTTLALTETLQVYRKAFLVCPPGSISWVRCMTDHSNILDRKVELSGYVVVSDNSFVVCDTLTCSCFHFDLDSKKWHLVMPWAPWGKYLPRDMSRYRFLNGKCVFVDGFIYTCSGKGLAAYELVDEDHCVYLDIPIFLPLSWESENWKTERMCLDYAGKDVNSGAILFWVVQGLQIKHRDHHNTLWITAVEVETEKTPRKSMKPVGIRHVVSATRLIDQEETIDQKEVISTRCCALSF
ncbi:unnamed protein product [Triticum turgidum subsp. durum]|uniref:Uncharacterized protein n=1 Tax=Triticum turgidum subsp. durum TaxID=4567 RepID=A0A9R1PZ05_TRITD|nr:unnamed protein product [Triticum turgidum subsp. durum]